MSKIKNINQKVSNSYTTNFVNIFGEKNKDIPTTGTYKYDKKSGTLIMIDNNIPKSVKDKMEPLTSNINRVKPVSIRKKGLINAH